MFKSCAKCGKIHADNYRCKAIKRIYIKDDERKLRSQYVWTQKSKEIRDKANYLCEVCKDKGEITYNDIEVHHITKLSEDRGGLLNNENLICLCQEHHKKADKGELDKEYLTALAKRREDMKMACKVG